MFKTTRMNKIKNKLRTLLRKTAVTAIAVTTVFLAGTCSVSAASAKESSFTVVLDAGHGGHDHGAIDNNAREKDINLGVTKKLASLIKKKMKNVNVVMTRDDDKFISLQERANIANRNKGNLFISIHTNSVDKSNPNRTKVSGTSVYALGPQKDANNLKVAQRENSVIELEDNFHQKYSGFDPSKDESYIIFEMAQKKNLGQSLKFADKAQKELVKTAGRNDRGVKQAGFWVLWATSMPSVLVELDFICNPDEAKFLTSEEGQEKLAESIFNALKQYVEGGDGKANATSDNSKVSSTDKTYPAEQQMSVKEEMASAETSGGVLQASASGKKSQRVHNVAVTSKKLEGPRKRRSSSSRQISDNRNVETDYIALSDETSYLVKEEKEQPQVTEEKPVDEKPAAKGKTKKKKEKEKKATKPKQVAKNNVHVKVNSSQTASVSSSQQPTVVEKSKNGNKVFTVKNAGTATTAETAKVTAETASMAKTGGMVYKILLIASEKELQANDPVFSGFVPTGMFIENNKYKYTYGSSTDRREIENKLLEVKSYLPEAEIVVRIE